MTVVVVVGIAVFVVIVVSTRIVSVSASVCVVLSSHRVLIIPILPFVRLMVFSFWRELVPPTGSDDDDDDDDRHLLLHDHSWVLVHIKRGYRLRDNNDENEDDNQPLRRNTKRYSTPRPT